MAPKQIVDVLDYMNIVGLGGNPAAIHISVNLLDVLNIAGLGGNPAALR